MSRFESWRRDLDRTPVNVTTVQGQAAALRLHPFEESGLGTAPFRYDGYEEIGSRDSVSHSASCTTSSWRGPSCQIPKDPTSGSEALSAMRAVQAL